MNRLLITCALLITTTLSGCTANQLYNVGQGSRASQCNKIVDADERNRCIAGSKQTYDDYKKQSDAATKKD